MNNAQQARFSSLNEAMDKLDFIRADLHCALTFHARVEPGHDTQQFINVLEQIDSLKAHLLRMEV